MADREYMQPPTEGRTSAPPLPFEIPSSRRTRKRQRQPEEDEAEEDPPQLVITEHNRRGRFDLRLPGRSPQQPPQRGFSDFLEDLGETGHDDGDYSGDYSGGDNDDGSFDGEKLFGLFGGRRLGEEDESDDARSETSEAPEAPGAPPAPAADAGRVFLPRAPKGLSRHREKLVKALAKQGFPSLKAAKKHCPLCREKYDLHLGSRAAALDTGRGAPAAGSHQEAFGGLNMVYVLNLDEPERVLFQLMEDYWEEHVVRVVEGYEQEPVRLSAAQIQLHLQNCIKDHPVESLRPALRTTRKINKRFPSSGLFIQEFQYGKMVGEERVNIPVLKEFRAFLKDDLALKAAFHEAKNIYRRQFGQETFCSHSSKRRRTTAS